MKRTVRSTIRVLEGREYKSIAKMRICGINRFQRMMKEQRKSMKFSQLVKVEQFTYQNLNVKFISLSLRAKNQKNSVCRRVLQIHEWSKRYRKRCLNQAYPIQARQDCASPCAQARAEFEPAEPQGIRHFGNLFRPRWDAGRVSESVQDMTSNQFLMKR